MKWSETLPGDQPDEYYWLYAQFLFRHWQNSSWCERLGFTFDLWAQCECIFWSSINVMNSLTMCVCGSFPLVICLWSKTQSIHIMCTSCFDFCSRTKCRIFFPLGKKKKKFQQLHSGLSSTAAHFSTPSRKECGLCTWGKVLKLRDAPWWYFKEVACGNFPSCSKYHTIQTDLVRWRYSLKITTVTCPVETFSFPYSTLTSLTGTFYLQTSATIYLHWRQM